MFWIIQGNLTKEDSLSKLINYIQENKIEHKLVKPIPFSEFIVDINTDVNNHDIDDLPKLSFDNSKQMVTIGSYTLAKFAKANNWTPGAFINENFEFSKWINGWGKDNMLNGLAIESKVKDMVIPKDWYKVFARPSEDTKSFAGQVFEVDNLTYWFNQLTEYGDPCGLCGETSVIVSPLKEILAEYRFFVVDGKVVTGSLYKIRDQVISSESIDPIAFNFANKMLELWQPDRAFVLDIAITSDGPKIIEVNNINSSGFYKANIGAIVDSINDMIF